MHIHIKSFTALLVGTIVMTASAHAENRPKIRESSTAERVSNGIVLGAGMAGAGGMIGMALTEGSPTGFKVGATVGGVLGATLGYVTPSVASDESIEDGELNEGQE